MSKTIRISGQIVEVTDEVYEFYYKSKRRDRYVEHDRKVGRINVDMEREEARFVDQQEYSLDQLIEAGADFIGDQSAEEHVVDRETLRQLSAAVALLGEDERTLIYLLYVERKSLRDVAPVFGISYVAVYKRHTAVLKRLQKSLSNLVNDPPSSSAKE